MKKSNQIKTEASSVCYLTRRKPNLQVLLVLCLFCTNAFASIQPETLADAIYIAEGGKNTRHPYGILTHFKTTTPRQACLNTIVHAQKDWNGNGDFISFLGSRYCPVGLANDPHGVNKNWISNVHYFYKRGVK